MKLKKFNPALILGACLTFGVVGCSDDDKKRSAASDIVEPIVEPTLNIVETAASVDDLSTLVAAVSAYPDIATALSDPDASLTVFAPTNAAFATLLKAVGVADLQGLIAVLGEEEVGNVLRYHVLGTTVNSSGAGDVATSDTRAVPTLFTGNSVNASTSVIDPDLYINLSKVIQADVATTNGVVHVVDTVLLPDAFANNAISDETVTVAGFVTANPDFSTLLAAVAQEADVLAAASSPDSRLTVFAPTNAAFEAVGTPAEILANPALNTILKNHILASEANSNIAASLNGRSVQNLAGNDLSITIDDAGTDGLGSLVIGGNGAKVTISNVKVSNGIIHVIDAVILDTAVPAAE
jgi:uncharacterized surface protein with fasciclin (FAS1) repeats